MKNDSYDYSVNEIDFKSACPVIECKNNKNVYHWVHTICGSHEKLNEKGWLRCLNPDCKKTGPIVDWKFKCENHDYKKASLQGLLHAFGLMSSLPDINQTFLLNLMGSVHGQYSEANKKEIEEERREKEEESKKMLKKREIQSARIKKKKIPNNNKKCKISVDENFKKFMENKIKENNNLNYKYSNKNINYACYNTNFNFPIIKDNETALIKDFNKMNLYKNNIITNRNSIKNNKRLIKNNELELQKNNEINILKNIFKNSKNNNINNNNKIINNNINNNENNNNIINKNDDSFEELK